MAHPLDGTVPPCLCALPADHKAAQPSCHRGYISHMLSPRLPLLPLLLLACSFRCITAQVRRVAWVGPAQLAAAMAATASCRCRPAPTSATLQGSFSSNYLILSQTRPSHNLQAGSNEPPRLIVQLSGGAAAASAAGGGDDAVGIASAAPGISNVKLLSPSLNMVTVQVASGSVAQTLASLQRRPGQCGSCAAAAALVQATGCCSTPAPPCGCRWPTTCTAPTRVHGTLT